MRSEFLYNYFRHPSALGGSGITILVIAIAFLGPLFTPQNPYNLNELSLANAHMPPAWAEGGTTSFLLGTDSQGRDILSAVVYGSRTSLSIGLLGMLFSSLVGVTLGLIAGYYGGWIDAVIMRIVDLQLSFPTMLIALSIMALFGSGTDKILVAFTLVGWVRYARTVRGEVFSIKKREYILAAQTIGLPSRVVILNHILPNVLTSIVVLSTLQTGSFILTEATLSFLGLGVPFTKPSLGVLLNNGFEVLIRGYWWAFLFPGIYIVITLFGINLWGEFLQSQIRSE